MLFHVTWDFVDSSEAGQKRSLQLFSKWTPGPGQFQAFYGFADGGGGIALIEAASAADLAKTIAPWTPFLRFTTRAILPIRESAEISSAAATWARCTVKALPRNSNVSHESPTSTDRQIHAASRRHPNGADGARTVRSIILCERATRRDEARLFVELNVDDSWSGRQRQP